MTGTAAGRGRAPASRRAGTAGVLAAGEVPRVLVELDVVPAASDVAVTALGGGVSSVVYLAEAGDVRVVVKQARAQLTVEDEWFADVSRSATEAKAAALLAQLIPGHVPAPLASDPSRHVFVMEAAPLGSVTWKEQLLAGEIDLGIATTVGVMLARIHESTRRREDILAEFDDRSVFFDLRLEPFLLALGRRHPDLAGRMDAMVTHLRDAAICLVHGDFSPKNLLISPDGRVLLIDHEVAHWGDPQFDLAFFLPHLTIKALREAADGPAVLRALRAFLAAYTEASSEWESLSRRTSTLVAAMTLARIDGKSPVEYLHDVERSRIRELMKALVLDPPPDLAAYVAVLDAECR